MREGRSGLHDLLQVRVGLGVHDDHRGLVGGEPQQVLATPARAHRVEADVDDPEASEAVADVADPGAPGVLHSVAGLPSRSRKGRRADRQVAADCVEGGGRLGADVAAQRGVDLLHPEPSRRRGP